METDRFFFILFNSFFIYNKKQGKYTFSAKQNNEVISKLIFTEKVKQSGPNMSAFKKSLNSCTSLSISIKLSQILTKLSNNISPYFCYK